MYSTKPKTMSSTCTVWRSITIPYTTVTPWVFYTTGPILFQSLITPCPYTVKMMLHRLYSLPTLLLSIQTCKTLSFFSPGVNGRCNPRSNQCHQDDTYNFPLLQHTWKHSIPVCKGSHIFGRCMLLRFLRILTSASMFAGEQPDDHSLQELYH